ncbi:MAG: inositol monophosphatase family protein [Actinomycetota bacterium]
MQADAKVALEAARSGAAVVREGFLSGPDTRLKGSVNPVTAVDDRAEEAIFAALSRLCPGEKVLGEESGGAEWDADRVWIVDPLDGTVNFIHGMPHVSVSVAVWERGAPVAGVVIDVTRREEFTAAAGGSTRLNGETVSVSRQADASASLVVTGFPYDRQEHAHEYASTVGEVLSRVQGVRRLGSAALDFAWVACGRFDGYWEYELGPWDAAAGVLLVEGAGGRVTDHAGSGYDLGSRTVLATNGLIHEELSRLVTDHLPAHLR